MGSLYHVVLGLIDSLASDGLRFEYSNIKIDREADRQRDK